ncbi:hypothetical protein BJX62DRAFT_223775 [Aspergillus germanicus]
MDKRLAKGRRQRRSGPRSKKGCLTCRGRHYRCDEARPVCGNCRKARLQCQQPEFVSSKWSAFTPDSVDQCSVRSPARAQAQAQDPQTHARPASPAAESVMTPEIAHLLRIYETDIATWMDVFDSGLTYQRRLLCMAPSSPLLLNAICALAAQQLSLIRSASIWKPVAEHYYGLAVHLLARLLSAYPSKMELAIVGTILLSSYELLASTGVDYQRHFKGAHTIVEAIHAQNSTSPLIRASFWNYARHEVAQALNRNSPTLHDPRSWPKVVSLAEAEPTSEDTFCNDVLRLAAETVCIAFRKTAAERSRTKRRKRELLALQSELDTWLRLCPKEWKGIEYEDDGNARYWFPRPNFAAALVFYHLSMLLLRLELDELSSEAQTGDENENENGRDNQAQVDAHSRQIIFIALSSLPDSAMVVVVQPLCYAVKYVSDSALRDRAILLLDDVERRTGFHTRRKLERQIAR